MCLGRGRGVSSTAPLAFLPTRAANDSFQHGNADQQGAAAALFSIYHLRLLSIFEVGFWAASCVVCLILALIFSVH
jgi:hypothetical protein